VLVHDFLYSFAVVLCVAAVTTVVSQKLKQPVVLGYILAGLVVGPHLPVPLVADPKIVKALSELGVILLMFSLGLEFRLGKLLKVGATAGVTAVIHCSFMLWAGFQVGQLFGWTTIESVFCGAIVAISSTTIVAKAFDDHKIDGPLRTLVLGELIVEDLIAILLMASLTALASSSGLGVSQMALTTARLGGFLLVVIVVGLLVVPRAVRAVVKLGRSETTLVAVIGICFAMALLAEKFGYSVALGAFLGGSLVAESGHEHDIEHLLHPVRDVFAATFFVSVGMLIDPRLVQDNLAAVIVLVIVVVVGKVCAVSFGAFVTGAGVQGSVRAGMSLGQIGEFSFIIAGLGATLGVTGSFLYPVAVAVSAITTLFTPPMVRSADHVARVVDRRLPPRLQTFAALYGSWIEQLKSSRAETKPLVKKARLLVLDAAVLVGLVVVTALFARPLAAGLHKTFGVPEHLALYGLVGASAAVCLTLVAGLVTVARRVAVNLAERAMPVAVDGRADLLTVTPRRLLTVTIQIAVLALVGIPVLAFTVPFLPTTPSVAVIVIALGAGAGALWKSTLSLQGHVKAGTHVLIEALARSMKLTPAPHASSSTSAAAQTPAISPAAAMAAEEARQGVLRSILTGLGAPSSVTLKAGDDGVGKALADLDVHGNTDATVLMIVRDGHGVEPEDGEVLLAGDLIALAGTQAAVSAASTLLTGSATSSTPLARSTGAALSLSEVQAAIAEAEGAPT